MPRKQSDERIELLLGALLGLEEGTSVSPEQLEAALSRARAKREADRSPREVDLLEHAESFERFIREGLQFQKERREPQASDTRVRPSGLLMDEEPKKRTSLRWMSSAAVGIAASILLMVVLPHDPPLIPDVEKIPLSPAPSMRDSARQRWEDVAAAWEAEDFARVRTLLDASLQDAPNDTTLLYSLGLASLRMNDHERALAALRRAHQLEPDSPSDEIRWILVAALDVAGQRDAGCDLLQELSNGSGSRSEQATERLHAACVEPKSP